MNILIIGAGGHARSVYECVRQDKNLEVVAFIDNKEGEGSELINGIPVLGPHSVVFDLIKSENIKGFIAGIGDNLIRAERFEDQRQIRCR